MSRCSLIPNRFDFCSLCLTPIQVLLHTRVTRYLEFKSVTGSYVFNTGKVHKVPATPTEALNSGLMGMFQKRRFKNFLQYINSYEQTDAQTHAGTDVTRISTKGLFDYYKLDENTQQFTGHAIALHPSDAYLAQPAAQTVAQIKLYAYSVSRYGNSPYIYPVYGLGGLPEGFSRLCAIHGGTYMLNKPVKQIVYDETGRVSGVMDEEGVTAKCKTLICDPSYVLGTDKIKKTCEIIRCISILSHPINETSNADSCQIILPAHQLPGRKSDIYISLVSYHHKVCADNKYIAVVSLVKELPGDSVQRELAPALQLLGQIDEQFSWVSDHYVPCNNPAVDGVYITESYDHTSHFESAADEVIKLYSQLSGKTLDLTISADPDDLQDGQ